MHIMVMKLFYIVHLCEGLNQQSHFCLSPCKRRKLNIMFISFRLSSPEKRQNNEKPPLEEEKKEKIELKSITSDGEANTATKVPC